MRRSTIAIFATTLVTISFVTAGLFFVHGQPEKLCSPDGSLMTQTAVAKNNLLSGFSVSCIRVQDSTGKTILDGFVYVASNESQREQGFQNATSFGDCNGFATQVNNCDGMIFVFPSSEQLCFWMHNTIIPLRQVWISENGTVSAVYNANSESDATVCHSGKYVLEKSLNTQISPGNSVFLNVNGT